MSPTIICRYTNVSDSVISEITTVDKRADKTNHKNDNAETYTDGFQMQLTYTYKLIMMAHLKIHAPIHYLVYKWSIKRLLQS